MLVDLRTNKKVVPHSFNFLERNRVVRLTDGGFWLSDEKKVYEYQRFTALIKDLQKSEFKILDIGCGKGRIPRKLIEDSNINVEFYYSGFDVDRHDIHENNAFFQYDKRFIFNHIDYMNKMYSPNASTIEPVFDFLDHSYDLIWAWSVFSHLDIKDFEIYMRLISDKLVRNGLAFLTCFSRYEAKQNPEYTPNYIFLENSDLPANGGKQNNNDLTAVCYHPSWIDDLLIKLGLEVVMSCYPIYGGNFQTGLYLRKV